MDERIKAVKEVEKMFEGLTEDDLNKVLDEAVKATKRGV